MKKIVTTLCAIAALALVADAAFAGAVRISQVYGGGGGTTAPATYSQDYVELFNASGVTVDISGWAVEYGSATGNWGSSSSNYLVFPNGTTIAPCSYLLINTGTAGTAGPANPAGDFNGTMNLSASNGKVGLFNAVNANVPCGSEAPGTLEDKFAYGSGNCPEGTATAGLSTTTGAVRNNGGLDDTDDNSADFTIVSDPVPHSAASGPNTACLAVPSMKGTWGAVKAIYR